MKDIQIAKEIYLKSLDTMKKILDLIEFGMDMRTQKFKYARSQVMEHTYSNIQKLFKTLSDKKIIQKCNCGANLRQGFKKCPKCGGSGYCNTE